MCKWPQTLVNLDRVIPQRHNSTSLTLRGELAQWLEQRNHNPLVPSSNLGFATNSSLNVTISYLGFSHGEPNDK